MAEFIPIPNCTRAVVVSAPGKSVTYKVPKGAQIVPLPSGGLAELIMESEPIDGGKGSKVTFSFRPLERVDEEA